MHQELDRVRGRMHLNEVRNMETQMGKEETMEKQIQRALSGVCH